MAEQMTPQEQAEWEAYKAKQLGKAYRPPAGGSPSPPPPKPPLQSPLDKQRALSDALRRREQEAGL